MFKEELEEKEVNCIGVVFFKMKLVLCFWLWLLVSIMIFKGDIF